MEEEKEGKSFPVNKDGEAERKKLLFREKGDTIMRLTDELNAAMKDLVDFMGCCKQAYISGDVVKGQKLRACIISTDIKPNHTDQ
jgi:hypothetical protein